MRVHEPCVVVSRFSRASTLIASPASNQLVMFLRHLSIFNSVLSRLENDILVNGKNLGKLKTG